MADREARELRRRYPKLRTVFIPHRIDIDFWRPLDTPPRRVVNSARAPGRPTAM